MIVIGEVLFVVCSLSYLVWWSITFRPSVRTPPGGGLFLAGAVLGGLGGLALLAVGIAALLPKASWPAPAASAWIVATAIATLVGLACYLIFYRLDPIPAYWVGMVPLAVDGVVAAILAAIVTLTRVP